MFCFRCGKADQTSETYCRQCGAFLPDISKPAKKQTPEDHVTANIVLSAMTIVACLTLAILLFTILGFQPGTHPLIYATAGLMIAIASWHVQTLWRTILLRRHFKERKVPVLEVKMIDETVKELPDAQFADIVPPSVTDRTTKDLNEVRVRSS